MRGSLRGRTEPFVFVDSATPVTLRPRLDDDSDVDIDDEISEVGGHAAAAAIGAAVVAGCSVMLLAFPPDRFLVKADRLDFLFHRLHVGVVGRLEPEAGEAERVFELSVAKASSNWKERKLGCH